MKRESFTTGVAFTLLSATGLALIGLFGKLGFSEFSIEAMLFWRYLAAFILCLIFLWMIGKLNNIFSFTNPKLHFLRAMFVLGAQYSFYYYIQRGTLMNGMVLLSLGPLFIPLIERVVVRRAIGKSTWISLIVSFLGVLCVIQPDTSLFSTLSFIGIFSGFCQGCSQVVFGISSKDERTEISTLYMFFICAIFSSIPYLIIGKTWEPSKELNLYPISLIFALGVASVLSQLARAVAYQHGTPSRLATFLYFGILLGGVFDWMVFHNPPNSLSIIGTILVISGGILKIYLRQIFLKK